jgi:surfeit locus 1 family protein
VRTKRIILSALCGLFFLLFATLGIWQLERRSWKLALIERVESRLRAEPVPIPDAAEWPTYDAQAHAYLKVEAQGVLQNNLETKVDALTERGAGFWLVTPLVTRSGTILINRGFVPAGTPTWDRPGGVVHIQGLLRPSEPRGRFLRANRPADERWFSRDVPAIAKARGLTNVAAFFIDADASSATTGPPFGGLTVVKFRNAHLSYALTWFALALLAGTGLVLLSRDRHYLS